MASAEQATVERVVTEKGFTLKLTVDEAETLVAVLARVGGSPSDSPRGLSEGVMDSLVSAGVRSHFPTSAGHPTNLARGSINFDDYRRGDRRG
ncbi:hypothetical protein [Streptomyces sp. NPDC004528]|uniref:hypothetical protein n=1 Tax=Streptomyces sp. NPDC004528 TaxID=3154550 RepID=UPI0033A3694B